MTEAENVQPASPQAPERPASGPPGEAAQPADGGTAPAKAPGRALPSQEEIAAWIQGADLPTIGALVQGLPVARFDALVTQIRKEELLPQHWQVIAQTAPPDDEEFDRLPEVAKLRLRYRNQDLSRRRLENLRVAWRELRGKRSALWSVADLFAALRRILDRDLEVDATELLTAVRDVWRDLDLPFGQEQLHILWNCLALIRKNTKK